MQRILSLAKKIPSLLSIYISTHILQDIFQLIVVKNKQITKSFPVEVHVTEHCNLNCKGCNHFSPLAHEEYLAPEKFEKDIKRLSELSERFFAIKILGGEPLLHPRITCFFDIARKYFPSTEVQLTTNGILLTKQPEEFWLSCQKNNIKISISQYPVRLNKREIKKLIKKYNIKYEYTGTVKEDRFSTIPLDLAGGQNIEANFRKCAISWGCCVTLRDGRIFTCCIAAHIKFFNAHFNQNLALSERDYIDIYTAKDKQEIIDFLETPFPFCRYCKTGEIQFGRRWGISKKDITEWTA